MGHGRNGRLNHKIFVICIWISHLSANVFTPGWVNCCKICSKFLFCFVYTEIVNKKMPKSEKNKYYFFFREIDVFDFTSFFTFINKNIFVNLKKKRAETTYHFFHGSSSAFIHKCNERKNILSVLEWIRSLMSCFKFWLISENFYSCT